jgi:excinuclease UvrABC helicase subunit UvrB
MSEEGEAEPGLNSNTTEMHDADKAVMSAHSIQYKNVSKGPELETEFRMYIANMTRRQRRREQDVSLNTTAAVAVAAAKVATDEQSPLTGNADDCQMIEEVTIYPASHFVTSQDEKMRILSAIRSELQDRVEELEDSGLFLEAERLTQRTEADLMQIETVGYCRGVWRA